MKEQIDEKYELSESIYMSGHGLDLKDSYDIAEQLYTEGYRKQNEGEFVKSKSGLYVCSVCDKTCPYDAQADDISYWECKFCPNCGAHMRKEDEGK